MSLLDKPVSFLASCNPDQSRKFYEDVLKLKCLSVDPYALVFDCVRTTLRIQIVDNVPYVAYTVLGWEVDDIEQCVKRLSSDGVKFETFEGLVQNDLEIWSSPSGVSVAWFKDPDGNILSLTQQ